jgi:hypothetical protein
MATETTIVPGSNAEATSTNVVALPHCPEPTTPSEKALSFVKKHPVLTVAGGLAVGFAISALFPRKASRKLSSRAYRLAEAGAAAALSFGQDALDKAEDGGIVARKKASLFAGQAEKLTERAAARAEKLGGRAVSGAERLGVAALGTAGVWGHAAAERAEHLGHVAAVRAEDLGLRASDRLSQLGDKAIVQSSKLFGYPKAQTSLTHRLLDKVHGLRARVRP